MKGNPTQLSQKTKPWQQSLRILPPSLLDKAQVLGPAIQLGLAKEVSLSDLYHYEHLGLYEGLPLEGVVEFQVAPPIGVGVWSRRNHHGWVEVHRERDKEWRTFSWESPNWGDWSRGSHTSTRSQLCYPRTDHPAQHLTFTVTVEPTPRGTVTLVFMLDEPLDTTASDFAASLFRLANFVQESTGGVDVFSAGATRADYLASLRVDWAILPILNLGPQEILEKILAGRVKVMEQERVRILDRLETLLACNPTRLVIGQEGFQRYFGGLFRDNLVVFENLRYGNALYLFEEDWDVVSRLSRTQLLNGEGYRFRRIVHTRTWKTRLYAELAHRLGEPDSPSYEQAV